MKQKNTNTNGDQPQRTVYTAEEAAALGVRDDTIYRLIKRNELKTVRGIRHKRILKSELERYAGGPIVVPIIEKARRHYNIKVVA